MDFEKVINSYKKKINRQLELFLNKRLKKAGSVSPIAKDLFEKIREFNLRGGKRTRGMLVIFGYLACGGKDERKVMDSSVAVELMESFLLIHDDVMDSDDIRRGKRTVHKIYEDKRAKTNTSDSKRYGESMAIIAGDILSVLGNEAILHLDFPIDRKLKAIDRFNRAVINTCIGQAHDLSSNHRFAISEKEILQNYLLKTAHYSVEAPLHIGAHLAGADKKQLKALSRYAENLGVAYQIQDDIQGLFGSEKKIGKPIGSDIKEGKMTLLMVKALEKASPKDRKFLKSKLGRDVSLLDLKRIQKIITETGALNLSIAKISECIIEANKSITGILFPKNGGFLLLQLTKYLGSRNH